MLGKRIRLLGLMGRLLGSHFGAKRFMMNNRGLIQEGSRADFLLVRGNVTGYLVHNRDCGDVEGWCCFGEAEVVSTMEYMYVWQLRMITKYTRGYPNSSPTNEKIK